MPPAMDTLLGWLLTLLILAAAYPWSVWLTAHLKQEAFGLAVLLSLALSTGALSLVMFWQALIGVKALAIPGTKVEIEAVVGVRA